MEKTILNVIAKVCVFMVLVVSFGNLASLYAAEPMNSPENNAALYPETIAVLSLLYVSEVKAGVRYALFAKAALDEGHDNIAHLLTAMAASEAVHAKSFKFILNTLGVHPDTVDTASIHAFTTKKNLKYATDVELSEIDDEYPDYLARIKAEDHLETIKMIGYAWQAEKQHRKLIKDIRGGTGLFFGVLLKYFRSNPSHYYVNDICGATVTELPENRCPICHHPVITYREIPKP